MGRSEEMPSFHWKKVFEMPAQAHTANCLEWVPMDLASAFHEVLLVELKRSRHHVESGAFSSRRISPPDASILKATDITVALPDGSHLCICRQIRELPRQQSEKDQMPVGIRRGGGVC